MRREANVRPLENFSEEAHFCPCASTRIAKYAGEANANFYSNTGRTHLKKLFFFTLMFNFLSFAESASASDCSCTSDPYTKIYTSDGVQKTWYGGKRKWSCVYSCENSQGVKAAFRGHHSQWYVGEDSGLWGICDGLVYIHEYNAYAQRFIWAYNRIGPFDPVDSKSPEVKSWARENCR